MTHVRETETFGPWNPGIQSELPRAFQPLSTMFRPENVLTGLDEARELSDFTGLAPHQLVRFRPERLITHELLIRVMADLSVPDGAVYEDLGINFREMVATIQARHIAPHKDSIIEKYEVMLCQAADIVDQELAALLDPTFAKPHDERSRHEKRHWFMRKRALPGPRTQADDSERAMEALANWRRNIEATSEPLKRATYQALIETVTRIVNRRGRIVGDQQLLRNLVLTRLSNGYGSEVIGTEITPFISRAADQEGYGVLPPQPSPVVMNVKGASAAGKSSMRPLQRMLSERLCVQWQDFALISPDIWRKYLLDYDSLGEAWKYAGTLTGHEVEVIDHKLDGYMAAKADRGAISHLLIDRFRFDSFLASAEDEAGGRLLTRFGDLVYMFFMVTPPEATVERAWKRGLQVGRFKALDDLLHHNVEAYEGMPGLFFTWTLSADKQVHCEFLDNSVAEGSLPRTIAFGWNGELNILDIKGMLDIDRFRGINIEARGPGEIYECARVEPTEHARFLRDCVRKLPVVNLVEQESGRIYAEIRNGALTWADQTLLEKARQDPDIRAGLDAFLPDCPVSASESDASKVLKRKDGHTLGEWGGAD